MSLHLEIHGTGKSLLLIHGWGMHGGVWQPILDQLVPDFSVHVVDLPGMGFSQSDSAGDLKVMADQVLATLPAGLKELNVCGWSLGGQVAMQMAVQQPDLIKRLVLIGTTPKFVNADDWQLGMDANIFKQFAQNINDDYQATLMKFLSLQCMRAPDARHIIKQLRESFAQRPVPSLDALQNALDILLASDLRQQVKQVSQPTVVIHGDRDSLAPVNVARWLAAQLPSAQLLEISGASHAPFLSHTADFVQALHAFLQPQMAEIHS
ncbi:MAG TPA: pimeloyl-ACP methyl ester esterase BioH [Methylophilaceae bacterium]|nr:pimeloyl-ACP methyl ester esterase BioH [Methylophilaceae bacterium]